jgi:hypothetical protein
MSPRQSRHPKEVAPVAVRKLTARLERIEQQSRATLAASHRVERRLTERLDAWFDRIDVRLTALELAVLQAPLDFVQGEWTTQRPLS